MVHSKQQNWGYFGMDPRYSEKGQIPESNESKSPSWLWGLLLLLLALLCAVFVCLQVAWLCRPLAFAGKGKRENINKAFDGPNKPPRPKVADALCEPTRQLVRDISDKSTLEGSRARPPTSNRVGRPLPQAWEEAALPVSQQAGTARSSSVPSLPQPPSQWMSAQNRGGGSPVRQHPTGALPTGSSSTEFTKPSLSTASALPPPSLEASKSP